jgi:hypothetical protein
VRQLASNTFKQVHKSTDNPNFQNVTGKGNTTWNNLTPDRKNVYDRTAERMTDMTSNKVDKTIEGVKDGAWNSGKN